MLGAPACGRGAGAGRVSAVPWCETCDRFYGPGHVAPDGTCLTCGNVVPDAQKDGDEDTKVPWHFWVLVVALVVYLGWRLVQTIIWLITGHWPG